MSLRGVFETGRVSGSGIEPAFPVYSKADFAAAQFCSSSSSSAYLFKLPLFRFVSVKTL